MNPINNLSPVNAAYIEKVKNNPQGYLDKTASHAVSDKFEKNPKAKASKKKKLAFFVLASASLLALAGLIYKGRGAKGLNKALDSNLNLEIANIAEKIPEKAKESVDDILGKFSQEQREIYNAAMFSDQKAVDSLFEQKEKFQNTDKTLNKLQETITNVLPKKNNAIKTKEELEKMPLFKLEEYSDNLNSKYNSLFNELWKKQNSSDITKSQQELLEKLRTASDEADEILQDRCSKLDNNLARCVDKPLRFKIKDKDANNPIEVILNRINKTGGYNITAESAGPYMSAEIAFPEKMNPELASKLPEKYLNNSLELLHFYDYSDSKYEKFQNMLIRQAVLDSEKLGYNGRVWAEVSPKKNDGGGFLVTRALSSFDNASGCLKWMFNRGFRFVDENLNKIVEKNPEFLNNSELKLDGKIMYLSDDVINKYLGKNS